jgi:hypothetical protein
MYNEAAYQPTAAETVMVHMMLAMMKFQWAARNASPQYMPESCKHYHYSLTFFYDLILGHSMEDLQALTMICHYIRNAPKPGAGWLVTSWAMAFAVELGLHRSAKAWAESGPRKSIEEIELRKRVFWVLYQLQVGLSGKLGRPMPISYEDIDVEFPQAVNDNNGPGPMKNFSDCSFQIGLVSPMVGVIIAEIYSTIYAVKQPPGSYEATVRRIDQEIQRWRESIPSELSPDSNPDFESSVFVRYVQFWEQEMILLLHHPSVCRSTDPAMISRNLDICLKSTKAMLIAVDGLRKLKSIDLTWMNITDYVAAMFTTLYVYTHRKDEMSSSQLLGLKEDMDVWLEIMVEVGNFFGKSHIDGSHWHHLTVVGTGRSLSNALRKIVDSCVDSISAHILKKTASAATARTASMDQSSHHLPQQTSHNTNAVTNNHSYNNPAAYNNAYNDISSETNAQLNGTSKQPAYLTSQDSTSSAGYSTTYPYPDAQAGPYAQTTPVTATFDTSYPSNASGALSTDQVAQAAAVVAAQAQAQAQASGHSTQQAGPPTPVTATATVTYHPYNNPNNSYQSQPGWRDWAQQMFLTNMTPQAYLPQPQTPVHGISQAGHAHSHATHPTHNGQQHGSHAHGVNHTAHNQNHHAHNHNHLSSANALMALGAAGGVARTGSTAGVDGVGVGGVATVDGVAGDGKVQEWPQLLFQYRSGAGTEA